ncbi:MAG: phosphoribosylanthranilate isomerase [Clostridia bacterium]|nr:phosphoribosylanthranilate isomerase [Clostridia bacterium]
MTKIKLCGLSRPCDIEVANSLEPEYVGFVFAPKSKRYLSPEKAKELKSLLSEQIQAVGVFAGETPENIALLLGGGVIDIAQLHGDEDEEFIANLRTLTDKPIIKAFRVESEKDIEKASSSSADFILLDSGAGTGITFNWQYIKNIQRPYFLAGGLDSENVQAAIKQLAPFAVDVSSGIETDGLKDRQKMKAFAAAVRKEVKL